VTPFGSSIAAHGTTKDTMDTKAKAIRAQIEGAVDDSTDTLAQVGNLEIQ
jgi:hypothetical protein